jgi:hypothetical protein
MMEPFSNWMVPSLMAATKSRSCDCRRPATKSPRKITNALLLRERPQGLPLVRPRLYRGPGRHKVPLNRGQGRHKVPLNRGPGRHKVPRLRLSTDGDHIDSLRLIMKYPSYSSTRVPRLRLSTVGKDRRYVRAPLVRLRLCPLNRGQGRHKAPQLPPIIRREGYFSLYSVQRRAAEWRWIEREGGKGRGGEGNKPRRSHRTGSACVIFCCSSLNSCCGGCSCGCS